MGVIVHGLARFHLLFPPWVEHGVNMSVETLHLVLRRVAARFGGMPPKLYVQVDNCCEIAWAALARGPSFMFSLACAADAVLRASMCHAERRGVRARHRGSGQ